MFATNWMKQVDNLVGLARELERKSKLSPEEYLREEKYQRADDLADMNQHFNKLACEK